MLTLCVSLLAINLLSPNAAAVQTVPYKVNFQGQLTAADNSLLPDGQYNMTFRLYSDVTGGAAVWTEVRDTTNRVTLTDGRFAVQLGDVTALSPTVFDDESLYFEVELPTPATATCATAGCAVYTEGPMTPRQPLAASPYAFNADQLDGYDASDFAVGGENNTFSGINVFSNTSTGAFAIQNGNGDQLLAADTSNMEVAIGTVTNGVILSLNGIELNGSARGTRTISLVPEYPGATFRGDGTSNAGSLSSDFCLNTLSTDINAAACGSYGTHSYYQWTSAEGAAQDYDIYVRYRLPSDYDSGSMTNLEFAGQSTTIGQQVALTMYNSTGTECATTGTFTDAAAPDWTTTTITSPLGLCSISAGQFVTIKIHLSAVSGGVVRAGEISFDYRSTF